MRTPTIKQKHLAEEIIKNNTLPAYKRKNKGQLLEKVSYSKGLQKQPSRVIETVGVQKAIKTILKETGLTEKLISEALVNDIKKKPTNRAKELKLASDIIGLTKNETNINVGVFNLTSVLEEARKEETLIEESTTGF